MTGAEYRAARLALKMTQDEWAAQIAVSRRTIVRLERMLRVPVVHETAIKVAANNPALTRA